MVVTGLIFMPGNNYTTIPLYPNELSCFDEGVLQLLGFVLSVSVLEVHIAPLIPGLISETTLRRVI